MIATDSEASSSSTSDDRNEIRSTPMVLAPVLVADRPDRGHLGLGPVEDLERGQARDDVEEVPGQHPQGRPLPVDARLRCTGR